MSIDYTITVGAHPTFNDFTDRTLGFSVEQRCGIAQLGTGIATITLDNTDGELTPNGTGTYAGYDWGKTVVTITANRPLEATFVLFAGFISDIVLLDDGTTSTLTVYADDPYATIGRGTTEASWGGVLSFSDDLPGTIEKLINQGTGTKSTSGIPLPLAGADAAAAVVTDVGTVPGPWYFRSKADGFIEDVVSNRLLPLSMGVMYPTIVEWGYVSSTLTAQYGANCVGSGLTADVTYLGSRCEYSISESPTYGSSTLTLTEIETGHNLGEIVNEVDVIDQDDTEYLARNTTSTDDYGVRAVSFTNHLVPNDAAGYAPYVDPLDAQPYVDAWAARFGEYRWTARRIATRASSNTSTNAERAFVQLLDVRYGQWVPIEVTYTPTGSSSSVVETGVIGRRVIAATPSDTVVTLELLPAVDYQSFTLDSDLLGILDQNRLG